MAKETLHLTLAFVGELRQDRLPDLMAAASDVTQTMGAASAAGLIVLDRLRYWPSGKMLWATCADCPPRLSTLADVLAGRLLAQGFILELRPWLAHVTLLRRFVAAPQGTDLDVLRSAPVRWSYRDFVLLRSSPGVAGASYACLGRWPLCGGFN
jgi:RNA 2',3'-cyclic 3'-phosphodiesterase